MDAAKSSERVPKAATAAAASVMTLTWLWGRWTGWA